MPADCFAQLRQFLERFENILQLRCSDLLVVRQILQPHILRAERDQDFVQLDVVIDVFLALFSFDLIERRLRDVNLARAHQFGHLPEEKGQQQRANVRAVHVGIGHDDDAAVAQFRDIEAAFVLAIAVFFRFANAGADGRDHRLDFSVFENLIHARFLDVDQLAANRQNRLIAPVASLLGGAAGGIALDNVKLGEFRIALRTIGQFAGQSAAGQRAFANCFPRLSSGFPRPRGSKHLVENAARNRRILVEVSHQSVVSDGVHDARRSRC